ELRGTIIRPVVHSMVDRLAARGRADLWEDLALPVPVRVIGALLDLPWRDDEWIERIWAPFRRRSVHINLLPNPPAEHRETAPDAAKEIRAILMPVIEDRRSGSGSDLISRLWRDG